MADRSAIEWTEATWNPLSGCSRLSAACAHCYAERVAFRFSGAGQPYEGLIHPVTHGWNGNVRIASEARLSQPLRWRRPRRIFVNSMSDLFHESVSDEHIAGIFGIMAACPQHKFQVLTKRPGRMLEWFRWREAQIKARDLSWGNAWRVCEDEAVELVESLPATGCQQPWPLPNVWLGVSVENQETADERVPLLLQCPAAVRWLSCEPLLGPIDLRFHIFSEPTGSVRTCGGKRQMELRRPADGGLHWVVAGGESGPGARPMHPDWARSLRDQCSAAAVPYFFKQWGEWLPGQNDALDAADRTGCAHWQDGSLGARGLPRDPDNNYAMWEPNGTLHFGQRTISNHFEVARFAERVGKKRAGRLLDGAEHNAYPEVIMPGGTGRGKRHETAAAAAAPQDAHHFDEETER